MQTFIKAISVFTLVVISINLTYSQNYTGNKDDIKTILANIESFSEAVMSSDYQAIGMAYMEDAKIFPTNVDIISGRDAIIKYWTLPEGTKISFHKITPEEIRINGEEAYDYGYYEGKTQRSDGTESSWKGKYVIIWKKVDKEWMIYLDIWNRINN